MDKIERFGKIADTVIANLTDLDEDFFSHVHEKELFRAFAIESLMAYSRNSKKANNDDACEDFLNSMVEYAWVPFIQELMDERDKMEEMLIEMRLKSNENIIVIDGSETKIKNAMAEQYGKDK